MTAPFTSGPTLQAVGRARAESSPALGPGSAPVAAPPGTTASGKAKRLVDWIWTVKGALPLAPGQSSGDALARLDPLFDEYGTSHERVGDSLVFRKKDQAAQDKMSIFDGGVLRIEHAGGGSVLRYRLTSRALLFCFAAPFMFIAIAQLTIAIGYLQKPDVAAKVDKKKPKKAEVPMNPIDKALGAPAPEKPGKKDKDKDDDKKPTPTAAYVFAAIFAVLYVVGRILEDRLVRSLFRKRLGAG